MLAYLIRRLLWMIPTFLGILVINFGVIRLQSASLAEQMNDGGGKGGSGEAAGGASAERKVLGASKNLENYLDRFRRSGNDLPALVNLRGFLDKDDLVTWLKDIDPRSPLKDSTRNQREKELWLCGRQAVLPLAEVLADESLAELHAPASLAFSLCAYITVSKHDGETLPAATLNRIAGDNELLRSNRIGFHRDAKLGFVVEDTDAAGKRARILAWIAQPEQRAHYAMGTARAWAGIVWDTGFVDIMGKLFSGRLESESRKNTYVFTLIAERWQVTLWLTVLSILIAWGISVPLGIRSARRVGSLEDAATTNILFLLWSLPTMFVGTLMLHYLCTAGPGGAPLFPNAGMSSPGSEQWPWWQRLTDAMWHGFLPLVCFTYGSFTALSRYMRGSLLDQLGSDYVRSARAKGCSDDRVVYGHALRNSMLIMITLGSGLLAELFGGSVVIERIFSVQGLGQLLLDAAVDRDAPLIMGSTIISVALLLFGILLADILYAVADPRIRSRYA